MHSIESECNGLTKEPNSETWELRKGTDTTKDGTGATSILNTCLQEEISSGVGNNFGTFTQDIWYLQLPMFGIPI